MSKASENISTNLRSSKSKLIASLSLVAFSSLLPLSALEFGTMGNLSASMGGAGVALKSPFALYYNPALLASESKIRFGYSAGIGISENNLDKLINADLANIADSMGDLASSFSGAGAIPTLAIPTSSSLVGTSTPFIVGAATTTQGGSTSNLDSFAGVIESALKEVTNGSSSGSGGGGGGGGSQNLKALWTSYKNSKNGSNDFSDLVTKIQEKANSSSSLSAEQKAFLNSTASSIDWSNFDASSGKITSLSIRKGQNKSLDKAMTDIDNILNALKSNNVNVVSQNGIVLQLSTGILRNSFGAIAIGIFNNTQANFSIKADPNKLALIMKGGNTDYYKLSTTSSGYSFSTTGENDYNQHSLIKALEDGNVHKIVNSLFIMTEVPVGYAYNFFLINSTLNVGFALKYMNAISSYNETFLSTSMNVNSITSGIRGNIENASAFGLDLGAHYEFDFPNFSGFSVGFVAKNINTPTFNFTNRVVEIKPQYRAGLAYNGDYYSLALDLDLWKNNLLTYSIDPVFSQVIGGGGKMDFGFFDLRGGLAYDFRQDNGVILTAGVNLLGFLDISAQMGTKFAKVFGTNVPKFLDIRVGGSFSF